MINFHSAPINGKAVETFLQAYGWQYAQSGDKVWSSGFKGRHKPYKVQLQLCDTWLDLRIKPLLSISRELAYLPEFLQFLLELNDMVQTAKLSLDADGTISLSLQLLNCNLDYEVFEYGLGILGYYADAVYSELIEFFKEMGLSYLVSTNYLS